MKAACALVCFALAQGITANIFKRSHRPTDGLIVQPLDYINQYQQQLYQPQEQTYQEYIQQLKQQQKKQQKPQYYGSSSHESSQQDSKEWNNNEQQKYVTLRSSGQKWDKPLFTAIMKVQNDVVEPSAYGQNIMWSRDIQMPLKQKHHELPTVAQQQELKKIFAEAQESMKHPTSEEKVQLNQVFAAAAQVHNEDDHLNATELLKKYKYPVEEHEIKTEDGYYLTLFHIPPMKLIRDVTKKPVVFLMHGLLGSADDWLLMGPGKSLAYLLSDAGYDVWLGNARGNKYSRRHVSKHPAMNDFWQFSNDEVALQDLPAMIDYALETSAQQKLYYVGHSQGTTAFFALTASKPEYNDKIIMMYALAPMVYMKHARSPLIRMIAPTSPFEQSLHHEIGHGEFNPSQELIATVGGQMLWNEIGSKNVSSNVNFVMSGVNIDSVTPELTPVIMRHVPAGTSTRVIKQYGQQVTGDDFRKYDFGPAINQKVYGSVEAPKYDMQNVKAPVTLYYAEEDWLASPVDVTRLQQVLPTPVTAYKVPEPHFSHLDFQFSTKAPELVYKQLIESMNNA